MNINFHNVSRVSRQLAVGFTVSILVCFLTATASFAATTESLLGKHFFGADVKVVQAESSEDLALARYVEGDQVVSVAIVSTETETLYYSEINDEGAILVSVDHESEAVTTMMQAHVITCSDVKDVQYHGQLTWSVCH